jgi:hypothetical protein
MSGQPTTGQRRPRAAASHSPSRKQQAAKRGRPVCRDRRLLLAVAIVLALPTVARGDPLERDDRCPGNGIYIYMYMYVLHTHTHTCMCVRVYIGELLVGTQCTTAPDEICTTARCLDGANWFYHVAILLETESAFEDSLRSLQAAVRLVQDVLPLLGENIKRKRERPCTWCLCACVRVCVRV